MSDLVGNPEDRFSRVAAHFGSCYFDSCQTIKTYVHMYPHKDESDSLMSTSESLQMSCVMEKPTMWFLNRYIHRRKLEA